MITFNGNSPVQLPPYFIESDINSVRAMTQPYHIADTRMNHHWQRGQGEGIKIGICDTGLDYNHPEIKDRVAGGESFLTGRRADAREFMDQNGHGTHVATTVAGVAVGMSPQSILEIAQVLGRNGSGPNSGVADGIDYLREKKCHIINLSLGGPYDDPQTRAAILRAIASGILIVAATGNERAAHVGYPAVHCIGIGAVDQALNLAYFSNRGKHVDLVGYGVNIYAGVPGGYQIMSGTSMATPFIAGCLAVRLSIEQNVLGQIVTTSHEKLLEIDTLVTDLGAEGFDTSYGRGFPDLQRAYWENIVAPVEDDELVEEVILLKASNSDGVPVGEGSLILR